MKPSGDEELKSLARSNTIVAVRDSVLDRWKSGDFDRILFGEAMREVVSAAGCNSPLPALATVLQEFSWRSRDAGFANAIGLQLGIIYPLLRDFGIDASSSIWKTRLASLSLIGALGITEPVGGSEIRDFQTRLVRDGSDFRVSGEKSMISLGPVADLCVVVGYSDEGLAIAVVDLRESGVSVINTPVTVIRTCPIGYVSFEDVHVSKQQVLCQGEQAKQLLRRLIDLDRAFVWRYRVGRIRSMVELVVEFGKSRIQSGRPLVENQSYAYKIGDLNTDFVKAEVLMRAAIESVAKGESGASTLAAAARLAVGRISVQAASVMLQMLGSRGLLCDSLSWMYFADSRLDCLGGGADEVLQRQMGREAMRATI